MTYYIRLPSLQALSSFKTMPWYAQLHTCVQFNFYIIKDLLLICNWPITILANSLRIKEELQMDCLWQECRFSRQLLQQEQALCEYNLLLVPFLKKFFDFEVEINLQYAPLPWRYI